MIISLIACIGKNGELGYNNDLIWKIPEDLAYFKATTQDHVVIMGQKTFESIGRPLPNRINVVLSDDSTFHPDGILIARNMEEALDIARQKEQSEVFFIGGAFVYSQAIKFADRLYLTLVDAEAQADTFFPDYNDFSAIEKVGKGRYKDISYKFLILKKNGKKR